MKKQILASLALGATLAGATLAGTAFAADAPVVRERGTIESLNGDTMTVATRNGEHVAVKLAEGARVAGAQKAQIGDIKPDSYIGTAAVPQADGSLKALEVTVFAPSMRGSGDGHYPWDLSQGSTMTNGAVGDLVGSSGRTMTVKYKGGEKKVSVPEDVPVVSLEPGDRSLVKPGAHVVAFAHKGDDGSLTADRMVVGVNGAVPPM